MKVTGENRELAQELLRQMVFLVSNDAVAQKLALRFAQSRGERGFTEDELNEIISWSAQLRIEFTFLKLVLEGDLNIDWDPEDGVMFSLNEEAVASGGEDDLDLSRVRESARDDGVSAGMSAE